jgi:serine/threonine protein phosphatase PrpC
VFAPLSPAKKPLDQGQSFFSVLDGHGGEWCAEWVAAHLAAFVAMEPGQHFLHNNTKTTALIIFRQLKPGLT